MNTNLTSVGDEPKKYKAFLSYSHAADEDLAADVQSALHRFAKPWTQTRAIRTFRDTTNLAVAPSLWGSIVKALDDSEFFILMASPEAARSPWVEREVAYWLHSRASENLAQNFMIVLTDGSLVWNTDLEKPDFDWNQTNSLPPSLKDVFHQEPRYVDLSWAKASHDRSLRNLKFRGAIADLATPLHGRDKDELDGEDVRQHNKTTHFRKLAFSSVIVLLVISAGMTVYAMIQSSRAGQQQRRAEANAIIAQQRQKEAEENLKEARRQTQIAEDRKKEAERQQEIATRNASLAEERLKETEAANRKQRIAKKETEDTKKEASRTALLESGREQLTNHNPFQAAAYVSRAYTLSPPNEENKEPGNLSTLRFLMGLAMRSVDSLRYGKTFHDDVVSAKFSPNGNAIAIACADNTRNTNNAARVLDVNTGADAIAPVVHTWDVNTAEFSPDGNWLVTSSDDDSAQVLDLRTGVRTPFKHRVAVKSARFSPDSKQIATVDRLGRAAIWDIRRSEAPILVVETKKILTSLKRKELPSSEDEEHVKSVEFSPDIKQIVIVDYDGGVTVCDFKTQKVVASLRPQRKVKEVNEDNEVKEINSAKFSPDGRLLVTASADKTAKVLDLETGKLIHTLPHQNAVISAEFSPDSKRIVTITSDARANIWEVETEKLATSLQHQDAINSAKFSPNGEHLVTASDDKTAIVWEVATGKVFDLMQHSGFVKSAEFSPDGKQIVTISHDKTVMLWDVETEVIASVSHDGNVVSAKFSNGAGKQMVTASWDKTAKVWDMATGVITPLEHDAVVRSAEFSHEGSRIVTCSGNVAKIWKWETKTIIYSMPLHGPCWMAEFSPDDKQIVISSDEGAKVLDLGTGRIISIGHELGVNTARFSPDGHKIVTASKNRTAKVWDVKVIWDENWNGKTVWELKPEAAIATVPHKDWVISAEFSPDGKWIVTAGKDGTAKICNVETNKVTATIQHDGPVISAEFSPDGKWIVTASNDGAAKIWDVAAEKLAPDLPHHGRVRSAKFSPDSQQIVTASADRTAKVWDVKTGKLLASIQHEQTVRTAEFSPDGEQIVTASFDKTAKVWSFPRESRTRKEIEGIVERKVPFSLEKGGLVPRQNLFAR